MASEVRVELSSGFLYEWCPAALYTLLEECCGGGIGTCGKEVGECLCVCMRGGKVTGIRCNRCISATVVQSTFVFIRQSVYTVLN